MDEPKRYATATAFRRALEDRLKAIAGKEHVELQRLRRMLSFDRLLARLFAGPQAPWVLKGGYAMELRMKEARATRDLDLALREPLGQGGGNAAILDALRSAAGIDLSDFFVFEIDEAMMELAGAPYGGARFPVAARMDNRLFVSFHLDVGVGDALLAPVEPASGRDWLAFAGIPAAHPVMISREQQFAEKLHAYTQPRTMPNSRVRDLVDMALLIKSASLDKTRAAEAVRATFARRGTHRPPAALEAPAKAWMEPFAALAGECGLPRGIDGAFAELTRFYAGLTLPGG